MSIEAGALIGLDLEVLHWHLPQNRSGGALPDSRDLWDVIQENKDRVMGFAHSHPGSGIPAPSFEDVSTFAAIEAALGKRLVWWITSSDSFSEWCWVGPHKWDYAQGPGVYEPQWMNELRFKSEYYQDPAIAHLAKQIQEAEDELILKELPMFQPTDKECADIKRVQETHTCMERTAIGGQWTYSFTPTSLGVKITIRCCICDYTYDATEYDSW